jgi:hypothetical protein
MPRRLVIKLTLRLLPSGITKVRCKRMRWRWTSIYFSRRRGTRFSTREQGMPKGPRLRLIGRPRRSRTRQKGMPRKVGDQESQRQWLPSLVLPQASTTLQSQNPRKQDSSYAQLSLSRLQQITSPTLMDSTRRALHVQEFFFSGSLLSIDAYYVQHQAFSKEWVDMKAFLELVCIFSY